jgi:pathogenesis-related protein 1
MKRCMTFSRTASELPIWRRGQTRAIALALAGFAGMAVACSGDDPLSDDDPRDGAEAGAALGGAGGGAPASAAGAPANGGRGGSGIAAGGRSGVGGSSPSTAGSGNTMDEPAESNSGAATGETGIFVGMTAAHNAAREALDEGLPDLTWSPQIAEFSQQWSDTLAAQECGTIEHRDQRDYGENIAMRGSTRLSQPFSPEEAVDGWVSEVACWDFGTISGTESCDAACVAGLHSNGCGHYTQVVWRNTRQVGCGYSTCENGNFTYEIWVCNYDPPGNFIGQAPY